MDFSKKRIFSPSKVLVLFIFICTAGLANADYCPLSNNNETGDLQDQCPEKLDQSLAYCCVDWNLEARCCGEEDFRKFAMILFFIVFGLFFTMALACITLVYLCCNICGCNKHRGRIYNGLDAHHLLTDTNV